MATPKKIRAIRGALNDLSDRIMMTDAERATDKYAAGAQYANPSEPATMRMSEALGNVGAEGKTLNFTEADRSRVFGSNRGGVGFSALQHYSLPHQQANTVWGFGNLAAAEKKVRRNDPEKSLYTTFVGSPIQHRSNTVVLQDAVKEFQKAVMAGNVSPGQIKLMNKRINESTDQNTGARLFDKGYDLSDPAALSAANTFNRRAAVGDVLLGVGVKGPMRGNAFKKKNKDQTWQDSGQMESILKRETDPDLVDAGTYDVGNRLFVMDNGIIHRPDLNEAFPVQVTGNDLGMKYELVPPDKAMRNFYKEREGRLDKNKQPSPVSYYDLARVFPSQFVDEGYLKFLQKEGYKKGGAVDIEAADARLSEAISQRMARGGAVDIDASDARLEAAINARMGNEDVPHMAKAGKVDKVTKAVEGVGGVFKKLFAPRVQPPSDNVANVRQANFQYPKTIGNQTVAIDKLSGGVRMSDPNEVKRVKALADKIASPEGYISRIIVDHNNNVIEGQHRLEALRQLGVKDVPVYKIEDLADTMPVSKMEEAIREAGGIHSDHVNQLMQHALEDIAEGGIEGARNLDYGAFQKFYDAALDAATSKLLADAPQADALKLAQERATLPPDKHGFGLPENNTAEQRAAAMGIKTDAYHGTKQDITGAFKPGYDDNLAFVTKSPEFANNWIGKGKTQTRVGKEAEEEVKAAEEEFRKMKYEKMDYESLNEMKGEPFQAEYDKRNDAFKKEFQETIGLYPDKTHNTVYPLKVQANKTFNPETDMNVMTEFFEKNNIPKSSQDLYASGNYLMYETKPVVEYLKGKGYDSMRLRESTGDDYPTIAVFNPETVRSRFAAFDPFRRDAATAALMGVAAPDLLAAEPEKKAGGGIAQMSNAGRVKKDATDAPTQEEIDAATRPARMNPNLAAQGQRYARPGDGFLRDPQSYKDMAGNLLEMISPPVPTPEEARAGLGSMRADRQLKGSVMQGYPDAQGLLADQAYDKMGNIAMAGMNVYHGTPHRFPPTAKNPLGEFDPMKIGTGEGAQAYGHGFYSAEAKEVGKGYRDDLGGGWRTAFNDEWSGNLPQPAPLAAAQISKHNGDIKAAVADLRSSSEPSYRQAGDWLEKQLADGAVQTKELGSLYKVDLPDEQIAKMLDWDKPLSGQPDGVRKALLKKFSEDELLDIEKMYGGPHSGFGNAFHEFVQSEIVKGGAKAQQQASTYLKRLGIPGIRYLDQGSRGASGTGKWRITYKDGNSSLFDFKPNDDVLKQMGATAKSEGTSNFVVFDPKDMNILEREKNGGMIAKKADGGVAHMAKGGARGKAFSGIEKGFKRLLSDRFGQGNEPVKGSEIFIGEKANTWDAASAGRAVEMEKAGANPIDIWKQTGTYRSHDGKLRQEISDVGSKFRTKDDLIKLAKSMMDKEAGIKQSIADSKAHPDLFPKQLSTAQKGARQKAKEIKAERTKLYGPESAKSPDFENTGTSAQYALDHPELYNAYPPLGDVIVTQGGSGSGQGSLMGQYPDLDMRVTRSGLAGDPRGTAIHEMQHGVQSAEGFSPGGNTAMAFNYPEAHEILKAKRRQAMTPMSYEDFVQGGSFVGDATENYNKYKKNLPTLAISMDREFQRQAAYEYYNRLAGEVEARTAAARRNLSPSERRANFPLDYSELGSDVLPEDIILKDPKGFASGGSVALWRDPNNLGDGGLIKIVKEGQHFQYGGASSPEDVISTSRDVDSQIKKVLKTVKGNAPEVYEWAKENVKKETDQLTTPEAVKDFVLRLGAQYLGGIPDFANLGLMGVDYLADTTLASEKPWFGSEQYIDAMKKYNLLGENEYPIAETVAGVLMPAGLLKKGIKKGYQLYKGEKPEPKASKKRSGGLTAMAR